MLRHPLLLGAALATAASAVSAQPRPSSREDLLDALTRHIQICSEMSDSQSRLACYDKLQTQVGYAPPATPQPTPLTQSPPPAANMPPPGTTSGGGGFAGRPLAPPPLSVPGGGNATLGAAPGTQPPPDQDRAFDPRTATYHPPDIVTPKPQPNLVRTGPRPLPVFSQPMPLVTLRASNLTGASGYWQVSVVIVSNTPNTVNAQVQCSFLNGGRSQGDAYLGPVALSPGEQISTDLVGPPTTAYVDSTNCRMLAP
ncbi:MAG TPA: hypothetical protein VMI56_24055 [Reyranella sp.]|nr:hypothetical protein [Reyranella sp.]